MVQRTVFLFVFLTLFLGVGSAYVHRRASTLARLGPRARRALAAVFVAGILMLFAARFLARALPDAVLSPPSAAAWTFETAVMISVAFLLLADLLKLLVSLARRLLAKSIQPELPVPVPVPVPVPAPTPPVETSDPRPPPQEAKPPLTRRSFLTQATTGSAFLIGSSSSLYGALIGRHDYHLVELPVPIPGLSKRLDGYTLVQLSDIHLGLFVGEAEMAAAEDLVRRAKPDLIVLTGDLIDHDPRYLEMLGRFTRRLGALSRDGVTVIPGNHDYYTGVDAVLRAAAEGGGVVLRNGGRVIGAERAGQGGFALLGLDDAMGEKLSPGTGPDLALALSTVPADLPRVLLWHNPGHFTEAAGKVALQLSGHTHGGQVNLGIRPAELVLSYPWIAGSYELSGTRLYVNRGFGTAGPPARIGAAPEVTRVVLVSA